MQARDFCQHSITLDDKQKQYANECYNALAAKLYSAIDKTSVPINAYIGGSLAIKEPALLFNKGKLTGLHSDMDCFLVVPEMKYMPEAIALTKTLDSTMPEIPRSFHVSPLLKIPAKHYLMSIEDLSFGFHEPVIERFSVEGFYPSYHPQEKSLAYLFVGKMCTSVLPYYITTHQYSNLENNQVPCDSMDTIKLLLTGLRLQYFGAMKDAHGFSAIPRLISTGMFDRLLPIETIHQLIHMREQYDPTQALPTIDIYDFVISAWQNKLKCDDSNMESLITKIQQRFFNESILCDQLAMTVLAYSMFLMQPDDAKKSIVLEKIRELEKHYAVKNEALKENCTAAYMVLKTKSFDQKNLRVPLVQLHHQYLQAQTDKIIPGH